MTHYPKPDAGLMLAIVVVTVILFLLASAAVARIVAS